MNKIKVFLCHASEDKPAARKLYHRLKSDGFNPWLDAEKLLPGQDWRLEIEKAVRNSNTIMVCLSTKSITKSGYVQKEIKYALDIADEKPEGEIYIIPAKLEECNVPSRLNRWHWVNLFEKDGYDRLLGSLRSKVTDMTEPEPNVEDIIDEGLRETRTMLVQSFVRWKHIELLPSIDKYKVITAYSDKLGDDLDNEKLAFMLKAALWYGHDVIYWAERNKENNEIIPILLEALQRPERRPFYRTGLAIEHLSPDFRGTVIKHIREQLPDNKEVETIFNKAEKNETLKFWEEDLPKIYEPEKAKQLVYRAKTSKKADYKTD